MKIKISRTQLFFTIPNLLFGKAIGITAGVFARKIGSDTWTSMAFGFAAGIICMALMTFLSTRFPGKSVIQYSQEILGKWPAKIIGLILAVFFIIAYGTSANVMTLHLTEYFLPNTPFFVVCAVYTLICMYGTFLGIEVIVRFSLLGFIMLLMINITMVIGTIGDLQISNLLPLLDNGIIPNIQHSIYVFSDLAMGILAVGIIFPMLNNKKKTVSLTFWALILSALTILIWPFFETGVMGSEMMQKYVVCCMQQIRSAQLTMYLPRYELLMVSFFVFSVYVQSVAMFYCAHYCCKQVTGIKNRLYILLPLTVLLIYITYYMAKDDNKYILFLTSPWPQICAGLCIGLPLILFIVGLFRNKLHGEPEESDNELKPNE